METLVLLHAEIKIGQKKQLKTYWHSNHVKQLHILVELNMWITSGFLSLITPDSKS